MYPQGIDPAKKAIRKVKIIIVILRMLKILIHPLYVFLVNILYRNTLRITNIDEKLKQSFKIFIYPETLFFILKSL